VLKSGAVEQAGDRTNPWKDLKENLGKHLGL
jgi:hypothetical protein